MTEKLQKRRHLAYNIHHAGFGDYARNSAPGLL